MSAAHSWVGAFAWWHSLGPLDRAHPLAPHQAPPPKKGGKGGKKGKGKGDDDKAVKDSLTKAFSKTSIGGDAPPPAAGGECKPQ